LYTSSYGLNFGRVIADTGDCTILKFKKISELPIGKILNAETLQCLDKWVALGESSLYVSKVMSLLRNLSTIIKALVPT